MYEAELAIYVVFFMTGSMGLVKSTYRQYLELCSEKDITYLTEREIK